MAGLLAQITVTASTTAQNVTPNPSSSSGTVIVVQNNTDYTGTYVAGRATMMISGSPSLYTVYVRWSDSASAYTEWTFSGVFSDAGTLSYNNAVRTFIDMANNTSSIQYEHGSGTLSYKGGTPYGIYWTESTAEPSADNTFFQKQ